MADNAQKDAVCSTLVKANHAQVVEIFKQHSNTDVMACPSSKSNSLRPLTYFFGEYLAPAVFPFFRTYTPTFYKPD